MKRKWIHVANPKITMYERANKNKTRIATVWQFDARTWIYEVCSNSGRLLADGLSEGKNAKNNVMFQASLYLKTVRH